MTTTNLQLEEVDANQDQKEVPINAGLRGIDAAFGDALTVLVDNTNAVSVLAADLRGNHFFVLTDDAPAPTADITVTMPSAVSRGTVAVTNDTSFDATVTIAAQPVTAPIVSAGKTALITVGTANVRGTSSGNFLELSDTPSVYTGQNGKAAIVNSTEDGLEFGEVASSSAASDVVSFAGGGALVRHSTTTSLANGAFTALAFDTEDYDTDVIHDTVTNNSRLTVPSGVTKVRVKANVNLAVNSVGSRQFRITKNGAAFNGNPEENVGALTGLFMNLGVASAELEVTPGDYFEAEVFQDSGGALNANSNAATWFAMEIVERQQNVSLQGVVAAVSARHRGTLVTHSTTQAVPGTSTFTALAFDTETLDTDTFHDNVTNNSRLTVPAGVTKVQLRGSARIAVSATGSRQARITKNGAVISNGAPQDNKAALSGLDTVVDVETAVLSVVEDDYFELEAWQDTGGNLNAVVASGDTWFALDVVERASSTDVPTAFIAVQPVHRGALVRIDTDDSVGTTKAPVDWDSAEYDTAFDPDDTGLPQRFWLGPDLTFTAANATNELTATAHAMATGEGPFELSNSGGALPTGLAVSTKYWTINVSANVLQVASSRADAIAGTPVTFSDDGTGTHTLERADRLVVPAGVNKVRVSGALQTSGTAPARLTLEFEKEGSAAFAGNGSNQNETADTVEQNSAHTTILEVSEGDVFKVLEFGDVAYTLEANNGRTWASIEVVEDSKPLSFPGVTVERPAIGARAELTANETLSDVTVLDVPWDQVSFDTGYRGAAFWAGGNPTRLTIPAGVSKVRLRSTVLIAASGSDIVRAFIQFEKNGSTAFDGNCQTQVRGPGNTVDPVAIEAVSGLLDVVAGDFFEASVFQDSSGATSVTADGGNRTWFEIDVVETVDAAFPPEQVEHFANGTPTASDRFYVKVASRRFSLNDDLAGSQAFAQTAPSGSTAFDVQRNGSSIGTVTFATSSQTATFVTAGGGQEDFDVGDRLEIVAPGTLNGIVDVAFDLLAFRT